MKILKPALLLLALLGLNAMAFAASALATEFEAKVQAAPSAEEALPVIREYLGKMSELDDLRVLQNYWMRIDKSACREHFAALHEAQPKKPEYHYLWLRVLDESVQQLRGSRQLIASAPDFYWGYRLFATSYAALMSDSEAKEADRQDLIDNQKSDLAILEKGSKRFPNDEYLNLAFFHHYNSQRKIDRAEDYLVRLLDPKAIESNFETIMEFVEENRNSRPFEILFPRMLSGAISSGDVASADSLVIYQYNYLSTLSLIKDWSRMNKYFEANPNLLVMDETLPTRIEMQIGLKNYDTALNLLEGALASEVLEYQQVLDDPLYEALHGQPRWKEVLDNAGKNWEQGRNERRTAALANKVDKPAHLWELPDKDGKLVRLEDLRGKIVVLDFWATWCSPCLKTMPLLDVWTRAKASRDLEVFSINTWESPSEADKVRAFMQDKGYAMTLLFGNNELPKAYGFDGIPFICVIDQSGNIAYEHSGYSPELPELLDFWVEDLRQ